MTNRQLINLCVYRYYRTFATKGPWAVHLTLDLDWGVGRYSQYHCCSYMQKSAQVNYLRDRHYLNSNRGYY